MLLSSTIVHWKTQSMSDCNHWQATGCCGCQFIHATFNLNEIKAWKYCFPNKKVDSNFFIFKVAPPQSLSDVTIKFFVNRALHVNYWLAIHQWVEGECEISVAINVCANIVTVFILSVFSSFGISLIIIARFHNKIEKLNVKWLNRRLWILLLFLLHNELLTAS